MTPECFLVDGALVAEHPDEPNGFDVVPGPPGPERGADNRPTLALWLQPGGTFLQFGSWWALPEQAIRTEVFRRFPDRVTGEKDVRVHPSVLGAAEAVLEISDGSGGFVVLKTVSASGYPPYAAVFSTQLDDEQADRVVEAITGTTGLLRIRYKTKLPVGTPLSAAITGDAPDEPPVDPEAWVDEALIHGRLTITYTTPYGLLDDALGALRNAVRAAAAREAKEASGGRFAVSIVRLTGRALPIEPATDIADWFEPGTGSAHIHELGKTRQPTPNADVTNGR
jgi:hypothetical protein